MPGGGTPEGEYQRLRAQGVPATEAWQRTRKQFPVRPRPSQQPQDLHPVSQRHMISTSPTTYGDDRGTLWRQIESGPVILLTIWWIVRQLFLVLVWIVGFTARVVVGLLWFVLGFVVGFRLFSR